MLNNVTSCIRALQGFVGNYVWVQQKISENHINFKNVQLQPNLIYKNKRYKKGGVFCCLLSLFQRLFTLAVVLILGACESKRFTTAEYKKPQKQNRKVCIHVFYSTKFYLHFHISIFFPYLNVNQMLFLNCYLNPQSLLLDLRHYDSC